VCECVLAAGAQVLQKMWTQILELLEFLNSSEDFMINNIGNESENHDNSYDSSTGSDSE
jgi:hypothetical protein